MKFAAIFLFSFVFSAQAFAQVCGEEHSKNNVKYGWCIDYGSGDDVIYFMHGGGGNEKSWRKGGLDDQLEAVWAAQRYERPTVISISFGPMWLITDIDQKEQPAYLNLITDEIMPMLEKKIGGVRGRRMLMGNSLGGFNSAELGLRAPQLFERVVLLCPGLKVVDPFLSDAELEAFLKTLPPYVQHDLVTGIVEWVRQIFGTREAWNRHDPHQLAANAVALKPKFFVSCTTEDEYGFYEPAKSIAATLATKTDTKWFSIAGGSHCKQTPESIKATAEFLSAK